MAMLAIVAVFALSDDFQILPSARAASPWDSLLPFKKVDAGEGNSYPVAQTNGPWMILAYTFRGEKSTADAQALVYELRSKYKLPAYSYQRTFDYSKPERGLGFNPDGSPKMMHYQTGGVIQETAVLVGDFDTVDDPAAQSILKKIKKLEPASIHPDPMLPAPDGADTAKTAPLALAMVVTNPLLPKEFFSGKGVDKFVLDLNKDVPNSLLDCPGKYSIQIATFSGNAVIDQRKIEDVEKGKPLRSQLIEAAEKAHEMTLALRNKGYEAYEFHDRDKSMVCVGSFDSLGAMRPDGTLQLDPTVQKIINVFGDDQALRDPTKKIEAKSIALEGFKVKVPFDVAPKPIEVPRRSISADYQRSMHAKL
ncbi:MAG TPA: hypothetical protein VMJ32_04440 [Pirellulales bacterium]|nr:hypothetical protein [Pirellulales bacterium]